MGNTSTKERGTLTPPHHTHHHSRSTGSAGPSGSQSHLGQLSERAATTGRSGRHHSSRNLENALLGLGSSGRERDREREREDYRTKEERRAERERERQRERVRERERSMAEESVDGGYLVTLGVYVGPEDYSLKVVRQLQIERRLAPFWRGLSDHESDWTDMQLVAVAKGLPLPAANTDASKLGLPAAQRSRAQSAKTLGISVGAKVGAIASIPGTAVEIDVGNATINNRPVEAVLYKDASECPICFLYYPPYLNKTRCCDQPICSECFVQIKRADPHPPEFSPPNSPNARAAEDGGNPEQLVSEPASCPFCKEIDFGITYSGPPFRRGLVYSNQQHPYSPLHHSALSQQSATSSTASLPSSPTGTTPRRSKVAATSSEVITTDIVRPDWSAKLAHARNQQARRAAAATALHTAAFLMSGMNTSSGGGRIPRVFRRSPQSGENSNNNNNNSSSNNVGSNGNSNANAGSTTIQTSAVTATEPAADPGPPTLPTILGGGQRRSRLMDLEEMMLMEAIRLSLAEEEERKRREEKENKKKEKEEKAKGSTSVAAGKGKMPEMREAEQQLSSSAPVGPSIVAKHAMHKQGPTTMSRSSSGSSQGSGQRGADSALGSTSNLASGDEDDGAGNEPMFNFQSLTQTLMDEDEEENASGKDGVPSSGHIEEVSNGLAGSSNPPTNVISGSGSHSDILASKNAALIKETSGDLKRDLPDTKEQRA